MDVAWQSWSHNTAVNPVMEGMEEVVVPESCCIGATITIAITISITITITITR